MQSTEFEEFSDVFGGAWEVVGRNLTARAIVAAFDLLTEFSLPDIKRALVLHAKSPKGREPPKPADIFDILNEQAPGGHPGADEAWGMVLRLMADPDETAVMTDEMAEAWGQCASVYEIGDEVGARVTFRDTYNRLVSRSRAAGIKPAWTVYRGTHADLCVRRVQEAIRMGRLSDTALAGYLPSASGGMAAMIAGMQEQAKQLSGPTREVAENTIARLRSLKQILEKPIPEDPEKLDRRMMGREAARKAAAAMVERFEAERLSVNDKHD
jgi:hypothetical protein